MKNKITNLDSIDIKILNELQIKFDTKFHFEFLRMI